VRERGERAELLAQYHLETQGLRLVQRNYRCRRGEIDLVMEDGGTLVFVEVRYRRNATYGKAEETIGPRKQARLVAAALHYLQHTGPQNRPCRFDVVALTGGKGDNHALQWITHAFEAN
jgi:putative endonuclease